MANKRNRAKRRRSASVSPPDNSRPSNAAAPKRPQRATVATPRHRAARGPVPVRDWIPLAGAGMVASISFVVYALTVQHTVPSGDSGELITDAYVLGVAHPPGYPLYMMLGYLATHLPGGSPALWMNLLSGLLDALTVGIVFLIIYRLIAMAGGAVARRSALVAGASGSLLLAFSSLFWAYSVVAEVFALNNLFAALLLLIAITWCRRPDRVRLLWLFMFVLGLALCNQQTIVFFIPGFAVLAWRGWTLLPRGSGRLRLRVRDFGIAVAALVVGLLPLAYLPIAASARPSMNWGDPTSWGRFKALVLRENYGTGTLVVGGKRGSIAENMRLLFGNLTSGFVVAGVALALLGLWWAWRRRQAEGIALFMAFLFAGPIFEIYTDTSYPDDLTKGIIARFYILPSIPVAIFAGLGAWWLLEKAAPIRLGRPGLIVGVTAAALLVVPVAAAVAHYSTADQSGNRVTENYGRDILASLPRGALVLMRGDSNLNSVSYVQKVEHVRTDVIALDTELLKLPSDVSQLLRANPGLQIPFTSYDGGVHTSLNALVSANLALRPVYYVGSQPEKGFATPFDQVIEGLSHRLAPKGTTPGMYSLMQTDAPRFASLHFPTRSYPSSSWEEFRHRQELRLRGLQHRFCDPDPRSEGSNSACGEDVPDGDQARPNARDGIQEFRSNAARQQRRPSRAPCRLADLSTAQTERSGGRCHPSDNQRAHNIGEVNSGRQSTR